MRRASSRCLIITYDGARRRGIPLKTSKSPRYSRPTRGRDVNALLFSCRPFNNSSSAPKCRQARDFSPKIKMIAANQISPAASVRWISTAFIGMPVTWLINLHPVCVCRVWPCRAVQATFYCSPLVKQRDALPAAALRWRYLVPACCSSSAQDSADLSAQRTSHWSLHAEHVCAILWSCCMHIALDSLLAPEEWIESILAPLPLVLFNLWQWRNEIMRIAGASFNLTAYTRWNLQINPETGPRVNLYLFVWKTSLTLKS